MDKVIDNYQKQLKKFEEEGIYDRFNLSIVENFISMICPIIAGSLLKRKQQIYNVLSEYSMDYTDVLSFTETKAEIEKIKYVFLNPKQLAIFNLISPPENPMNIESLKKKVSILYKYSRDKKAQLKQAIKFLDDLKLGKPKTKLDFKILELLG